jgi:hypothetical protein
MSSTKYIGLDVHKESISIAVMNSAGKIVMECVIETKASTVQDHDKQKRQESQRVNSIHGYSCCLSSTSTKADQASNRSN